ncbi:alpha/beta hydrolase [Streptomyces sp. NBC_00353]|uniref:alpha/beta fold hydrolase n=1 Tax=Streptomyces sp. NBC_00353 TaxID=2975722 RepID=UPI002E272CBC
MTRKHLHRSPWTYATVLGASAAAIALTTTAPGMASAAGRSPATKPTVVLVHGAFADSSSWNGVIANLQRAGYPVAAPANPLRGLTQDAGYLSSFLKSVHGPVVLVGHSYGGSVISQAAAEAPNVKALVYIAGFSPDKGENAADLSGKFPGSTLGPTLNSVSFPLPDGGTGSDLYIKADKFHDQFAADVPKSTTDLMAATQRPVAASALTDKATAAAWKTIPSWDLVTLQDKNIPAAAQKFMAKRAHSHTIEIQASHAVPVSHPAAVASLIEKAAHSTVR